MSPSPLARAGAITLPLALVLGACRDRSSHHPSVGVPATARAPSTSPAAHAATAAATSRAVPAVPITVTDGALETRLQAGELGLVVEKRPFAVRFLDGAGAPLGGHGRVPFSWRARGAWHRPANVTRFATTRAGFRFDLDTNEPGRTVALAVAFPHAHTASLVASLSSTTQVSRFAAKLATTPDEGLYGGGERFNRVEMRGETASLWTLHQHGLAYLPAQIRGQTDNCPVPVVLSTRGWGVSFDTTARGTLEFPAAGRADPVALEVEDATLAWHVVAAREPLDLIGRAALVHGRPRLPPRWFFAPHKWRDDVTKDGVPGEQLLLEDARKLRAHAIPFGAIWLDNPWDTGFGDFTFDALHFPDPDRLIRDLGALGARLVCWASPYLATGTQAFRESKLRSHHVRHAQGGAHVQVDFTSNAATTWWKDRLKTLLRRGVMGIKADRGEENECGPSSVWANGLPDRLNHNLYPRLYAKAVSEAVREVHGDEGIAIGRAGGAGAWAHWTALWTADNISWVGDPKGLRGDVRAHITASLSGYPFVGGDAGGYVGTRKGPGSIFSAIPLQLPRPVTLLRWVQFASITPFLEVGGVGPHEVWDLEALEPGATANYRRYSTLHVELFPYLWALSHEAVATGHPLLRALYTEDPRDLTLRAIDDELLLGDALLAAPIADDSSGVVPRRVVLPRGEWIDWWNGERLAGGRAVTRPSPLDELPLYLRAGAILPVHFRDHGILGLGPQELERPDRLGLAFAAGAGTSRRVLPDGTSLELRSPTPRRTELSVNGPARRLALKVFGDDPRSVTVGGRALARVASPADLATRDGFAWTSLGKGGVAWVAFGAGASGGLVQIDR